MRSEVIFCQHCWIILQGFTDGEAASSLSVALQTVEQQTKLLLYGHA